MPIEGLSKNSATIEVFNHLGQKVHSEIINENGKLNLTHLPKGVYLIKLQNGKYAETIKWVMQ
ncbi:MAG: T9SS type A sorting domain-containing protein [Salinivirgaceae bacterium]|nr:T9SS type A sorting domain-containing protein [Salinivirgaceae bacterium]